MGAAIFVDGSEASATRIVEVQYYGNTVLLHDAVSLSAGSHNVFVEWFTSGGEIGSTAASTLTVTAYNALASGAAPVSTQQIYATAGGVTSGTSFSAVPDLTTSVALPVPKTVEISSSLNAYANGSSVNNLETAIFVDGLQATNTALTTFPGGADGWEDVPLQYAVNLSAGYHLIRVEWLSASGAPIYLQTASSLTVTTFNSFNPVITSLGANTALPGSSLIIVGSNFDGTSVVKFNGVGADTGYLDGNDLIASVPQTGAYFITVFDSLTGLTSNAVYFTSLDLIPPITTDSLSGTAGANGWFISAVQVTLNANDPGSGIAAIRYTIDGGPPQTYGAPFPISTDGDHTLAFYSSDNAGNVEAANFVDVKIDTTAPDTTIDTGPAASSNTTSPTFTFHGADVTSGISYYQYLLDNGTWTTTNSPLALNGLAEGSHSIEVQAVNGAGLADATPASYSWTVDTTAPTVQNVQVYWGTAGVASLSSVPSGVLPWQGINKIQITFSENVIVNQGDLTLTGYSSNSFTYNSSTHKATWSLSAPLGIGSQSLDLFGTLADAGVQDEAGTYLAGGDYLRNFRVLWGDVTGDRAVNASDLTVIRNNFTSTSVPDNLLDDLNGDGVVDILDYNLTRVNVGKTV